jgi:hypothetical protein
MTPMDSVVTGGRGMAGKCFKMIWFPDINHDYMTAFDNFA